MLSKIQLIKTIRISGRNSGIELSLAQAKKLAELIMEEHGGQTIPHDYTTPYRQGFEAGIRQARSEFALEELRRRLGVENADTS